MLVLKVEEGMRHNLGLRIFVTEKVEGIYSQAWYLQGAEEVVALICEAGVEVGFPHPNYLELVQVPPRNHLISSV